MAGRVPGKLKLSPGLNFPGRDLNFPHPVAWRIQLAKESRVTWAPAGHFSFPLLPVSPLPLCVCVCVHAPMHTHVGAQSCLTLCSPTDCSLPGSSVHGILQASILKCVAISSPRGSSQSGSNLCLSHILHFGRWILYHCSTWKTLSSIYLCISCLSTFLPSLYFLCPPLACLASSNLS